MKAVPDPTATVKAADKARYGFERLRGVLSGMYGSPLPETVEAELADIDASLESVKQEAVTIGRQARDAMRDRQKKKDAESVADRTAIQSTQWQKTIALLNRVGLQFSERACQIAAAKGLHWIKVQALAYVFDHNRGEFKGDAAYLYTRITETPPETPPLQGWRHRMQMPPKPDMELIWLEAVQQKFVPWNVVKCACDLDAMKATPEKRDEIIDKFCEWMEERLREFASARGTRSGSGGAAR